MKTVPEILREAAETYEERSKVYGDNYKFFGDLAWALFQGKTLVFSSKSDFARLGVLIQVLSKISRYCQNFEKGGHEDSIKDLAVYASMLAELDEQIRNPDHSMDDLEF